MGVPLRGTPSATTQPFSAHSGSVSGSRSTFSASPSYPSTKKVGAPPPPSRSGSRSSAEPYPNNKKM